MSDAFWAEAANVATTFGGIALFIALWSLFIARRQSREEFEMHYVDRYWRILDRMSPEFRFRDAMPTDSDVDAVYDYIALCEDEIDLRLNGYLTDRTWECWSGYINYTFKHDGRYKNVLEQTRCDQYPSLKRFLEQYDENDKSTRKTADPRAQLTFSQRIRDLVRF